MDRFTRRELKHDELQSVYHGVEQFAKAHYRELSLGTLAVIIVVALVVGLKDYMDRQETAANTDLGAALQTFTAYVGPTMSPSLNTQSFATAEQKYKKALAEFSDIPRKYPRQKAAAIARYHVGLCQAELGDHVAAIKTLEEGSRASDSSIAALAKLALAGQYASTGKTAQAEQLYQQLADHPTLTVPKATALLALANLDSSTNPAKSRQIYQSLQKEFASDASLASLLKERIADLPK